MKTSLLGYLVPFLNLVALFFGGGRRLERKKTRYLSVPKVGAAICSFFVLEAATQQERREVALWSVRHFHCSLPPLH